MRAIVLNDARDVTNLRLSSPKARSEDTYVSTVHVQESRGVPGVVLSRCRVRRYSTNDDRSAFSMVLAGLSEGDAQILRGLLDEIVSYISEKRHDWFPAATRPRNIAAIQRCFNDPLDESAAQLLVSGARKWSSKSAVTFSSGKLHDVHLALTGVLFEDANITVEWRLMSLAPTASGAVQPQPILRRPLSAARDAAAGQEHALVLPDSDDAAEILAALDQELERARRRVDDVKQRLDAAAGQARSQDWRAHAALLADALSQAQWR